MTFALADVAQLVGALSYKPKLCVFDSWSGHMPRLSVRSPVGSLQEVTSGCLSHTLMLFSLSLSQSNEKMSLGEDKKKR